MLELDERCRAETEQDNRMRALKVLCTTSCIGFQTVSKQLTPVFTFWIGRILRVKEEHLAKNHNGWDKCYIMHPVYHYYLNSGGKDRPKSVGLSSLCESRKINYLFPAVTTFREKCPDKAYKHNPYKDKKEEIASLFSSGSQHAD